MAPGSIPPLSETDRQRFQEHLRRDPDTNCLLWTGGTDGRYGTFYLAGKMVKAHRVAFVEAGGVLTPEKPHVLHDCPEGDNGLCCEPEHLWAGNDADNAADMARKGRGKRSRKGLPFGVRLNRNGRFGAEVSVEGRSVRLGAYDTSEEAAAVALEAKEVIRSRLKRPGLN